MEGHVLHDLPDILTGPPAVRIVAPAFPTSLRGIRQAVDTAARDVLDETRRTDVAIAVSEAVSNAILHAYTEQAPGSVVVEVWIGPGCMVVAVADRGAGYGPGDRSVNSGLGLGVQLMATLADEAAMRSGPSGTRVVMTFRPRPEAAA